MQSFFIALQFLSRIHLVKQTVWPDRAFGQSIIWFPLIGTVIGAILCVVCHFVSMFFAGIYMATILVAIWLFITGGLHADGCMDTADGLFSGRDREQMLEIMKDSRVGSYGVMAFVLLVLLKICFLASIDERALIAVLVGIPTAARFGTLISILAFPYARKQGLGRTFKKYAPSHALFYGLILTLLPGLYIGWRYLLVVAFAVAVAILADLYILRRLGGLTGDTYGAVLECNEMLLLGFAACLY